MLNSPVSLQRVFLMPQQGLPVSLAEGALRYMPRPALEHALDMLVLKMEKRHPRLFRNLERLNKAVIHFEPTDIPRRFALTVGEPYPAFSLLDEDAPDADACIAGPLELLLDMLEGRSDGDTLFFERGITITGNTEVVVALRNTLDREEINLMDDVTSFFGPFAEPAAKALTLLDKLARRAGAKLSAFHDEIS